ncbi:putative ABC transporter membrane subunit YhdY [uncultured Gammaproteobacteria bacterium]
MRPPSSLRLGPLAWLRANLFNSWLNSLITLVLLWMLLELVPPLLRWLVFNAQVSAPDAQACRAAGGACWAFIREKYRLILFSTYPYDQQWRPLLAILAIMAMLAASCDRRLWRWLPLLWLGGLGTVAVLMWGGVFGLPFVENRLWGGLPLTLILATVGLMAAFPLSILLALARRSDMPVIRAVAVIYIELIRGVPLVSLLFMASIMLPLFLPAGVTIDKLLRAQIAFILFASAFLAESIRAGLQAIPHGQYEAADALGLGYWRKMRLVVLPQALTLVIPPMVNTFIVVFKDTSLVVIVGLLDLLTSAKISINSADWRGFYREAYLFIAVIYFVFCFFMSRYSQWLERDLRRGPI